MSVFLTFQAERPNQWHLSYSPRRKTLLWPEKADQFGRSDDDTKKNIRLFLDYSVTIKAIFNLLAFETKPSDALATTSRDAMLAVKSPIAKP